MRNKKASITVPTQVEIKLFSMANYKTDYVNQEGPISNSLLCLTLCQSLCNRSWTELIFIESTSQIIFIYDLPHQKIFPNALLLKRFFILYL